MQKAKKSITNPFPKIFVECLEHNYKEVQKYIVFELGGVTRKYKLKMNVPVPCLPSSHLSPHDSKKTENKGIGKDRMESRWKKEFHFVTDETAFTLFSTNGRMRSHTRITDSLMIY